eukprot:11159425-Lingulodinium_polyedra.AAC.1
MAEGEGDPTPWRRVQHVMAPGPEVRCLRCGGSVPAGRRASFAGRRRMAKWRGLGQPIAGAAAGPDWGA